VCGTWPDTHIEGRISSLPTVEEKGPKSGEENQIRRLFAVSMPDNARMWRQHVNAILGHPHETFDMVVASFLIIVFRVVCNPLVPTRIS
jgi:hypothetical protein